MRDTSTTEPHKLFDVIEHYADAKADKFWQDDQGFGPSVAASQAKYDAARKQLLEALGVDDPLVVAADPGPNSPEHMTLLAYSEWLDSEGLVKPDHEVPSDSGGAYVVDDRPHDQLVAEFLEQHKAGA